MANELVYQAAYDSTSNQGNHATRGQSTGSTVYDRANFGWMENFTGSDEKVDGAIRFTGVAVAKNTTVASANLGFYIEEKHYSSSIQTQIYGIDQDNTAIFNGSNSPFGRDKTTANTTPTLDASISAGGYWATSVTGQVNEILGRAGWSSGNAMGFIINYTGSTDSVDRYALDFESGTNSYLSILVATNPDFYPDPSTATAPSNPTKTHNYGIKIAKDGVDVFEATDEQLAFSSSWPILKAQLYGLDTVPVDTVKQIAHDLGYKGFFLTYGREDLGGGDYGNTYKMPAIIPSSTKSDNLIDARIDNSNLNVESVPFVQGATTIPLQIYYYIFIDDIDL